jgi:TolB-like protein
VEARAIAEGGHVRIEARAVSGDREEKLWVDSFAGLVDDIDAVEREVAAAVGSALAMRELAQRD